MVRNRKEQLTLASIRVMQAILQDMQLLSDALEENVELFAHDQRNFGAQQVNYSGIPLGSLMVSLPIFFSAGNDTPRSKKLDWTQRNRARLLDDRSFD
jgi:hypothetical protein